MGKASYSPLGQWRNKVGGQVYRVDNGEQIITAYQPVVKNPRTEEQQSVRTDFAAASKFIRNFRPWIYAVNPRGNKRMMRAYMMKQVLTGVANGLISVTSLNNKLVRAYLPVFDCQLDVITPSATNFVLTGTIANQMEDTDFVDGSVKVLIGVSQLDANGDLISNSLVEHEVSLQGNRAWTETIDFVDGAMGAVVEVAGVGTLTEEAWNRHYPNLFIDKRDADTIGLNSIYSDATAKVFTTNQGRGTLRLT